MSIRIATEMDAPQIASLVASLAHYYLSDPDEALPAWFRETINHSAFIYRINSPEYLNYVFEEAGVITGYVSLKGNSHLYHLFVSEESQGKGRSRLLWQHVKECSRSNKYTVRSSLYAVPFYKRFGFIESGPVSDKDGISFQPMEFCYESQKE